jgi:hypothetical protein
MLKTYVCIPRSFLVINVCNQGKTLCSPCTKAETMHTNRPIGYLNPGDVTDRLSRNVGKKLPLITITNYIQQDATFLETICFYRRSTCFRRFLYPSSGAHNCTYSFRYWLTIPAAVRTVIYSWRWTKELPETCTASVKINKFKKRCILLDVICNYITIHGHMNIELLRLAAQ